MVNDWFTANCVASEMKIFQGHWACHIVPSLWDDPSRSVCNKKEAVVTLYDKGSMGYRKTNPYAFAKGSFPHMLLELWFGSDYKFSESVIRARTCSG